MAGSAVLCMQHLLHLQILGEESLLMGCFPCFSQFDGGVVSEGSCY